MKYFHVTKNQIKAGSILNPRYGKVVLNPRFYRESDHNHNLYIKEMIFEEIRVEKYSFLPSRLNSIYLFSDIEQARMYPQKINSVDEMTIFEIEMISSGPIGEFDMTWLDLAVWESYEKIKDIANNYWVKKESTNKFLEVLFGGIVKVTKRVE